MHINIPDGRVLVPSWELAVSNNLEHFRTRALAFYASDADDDRPELQISINGRPTWADVMLITDALLVVTWAEGETYHTQVLMRRLETNWHVSSRALSLEWGDKQVEALGDDNQYVQRNARRLVFAGLVLANNWFNTDPIR